MTLPFELAQNFNAPNSIDPTQIVVGRSYYFLDASPTYRQDAQSSSILNFDDNALDGQIAMVLGTPIGSEEHEPSFGSDLMSKLFDPVSQTITSIELSVITSLKQWLGNRADFTSVTINTDGSDQYVVIAYRSKADGVRRTFIGNLSNIAASVS